MIEYFYDTYALVEYINENPKYKKYFQEKKGVTTKLNLMELYYAMLKDISKEKAEIAFESLLPLVIETKDEIIKESMELRLEFKKKKINVSYIDAIGYQLSLANNIKFLTGNKEFKNMKNVQFVK